MPLALDVSPRRITKKMSQRPRFICFCAHSRIPSCFCSLSETSGAPSQEGVFFAHSLHLAPNLFPIDVRLEKGLSSEETKRGEQKS